MIVIISSSAVFLQATSCTLNDTKCFQIMETICVLFFFFITVKCFLFKAAAAKPLQSCPTLCDRIDGSPPGAPVPGILQARTLEWVAISFSNA